MNYAGIIDEIRVSSIDSLKILPVEGVIMARATDTGG